MHISEGVLSPSALAIGWGLGATGVAYGLKRMAVEHVPRVAVLSAAFFTASFIHVPVGGGSSVHLLLVGLVGLVLGWAAFPALFVALFLQAVMFQFGGITPLGANTFVMAAPAVACHYLFGRMARSRKRGVALFGGGAAGACGIVMAYLLWSAWHLGSREEFRLIPLAGLLPHAALAGIEAFVTATAVSFLRRVRPEVLTLSTLADS